MTEKSPNTVQVFCGELCTSNICNTKVINLLNHDINGVNANVTIGYEKFVSDPETLPSRILDLLQIAAFVFCADRLINRGKRDSIDNTSWARSFEFNIPVMDIDFWANDSLSDALSQALQFMTGDRKYRFIFKKASQHILKFENKQLLLFTDEISDIAGAENADVLLFSGGLDSLTGAIQHLNEQPDSKIFLISHKSNNTTTHTQKVMIDYLKEKYNNRLLPYGFECHNKQVKSKDETQRTRMFLYSAIAFSICNCCKKHAFNIYENGITSINLPKQSDLFNARASRTTHPQTLGLLKKFFKFFDDSFDIITPYYDKTKADILTILSRYHEENIMSSSISCSSTRNKPGLSAHCGCCSQCIDRRLAAYAVGLSDFDAEYTHDFILNIPDDETKQRLYNTLRLASAEKSQTIENFYKNYADDLTNVIEYWPCDNGEDSLAEIYGLYSRFGDSVMKAAKEIQQKHEDLSIPVTANSFLEMLSSREYLNSPVAIRVSEIDKLLNSAMATMFQREKPQSENDMNDKIQAILNIKGVFTREYPVLLFGITSYRADHAQEFLIIESKYLRGKTTPSVISEGIAADITKIPKEYSVMFIVYDPERKIVNDTQYIKDYEQKRKSCFVRIYR